MKGPGDAGNGIGTSQVGDGNSNLGINGAEVIGEGCSVGRRVGQRKGGIQVDWEEESCGRGEARDARSQLHVGQGQVSAGPAQPCACSPWSVLPSSSTLLLAVCCVTLLTSVCLFGGEDMYVLLWPGQAGQAGGGGQQDVERPRAGAAW